MSYIGQTLPADTFQGFTTDSFTGDGSATTFTLSKTPFSEDTLIVVINNVIQKPTTNFTVSGTTLTIVGTAVASGDVIYAIHMGGVVPSTLASKVDVNGVSDAIILDADADTTISADTDDQIDFKAGGTDVMSMTATGLTINDGTTITTADNTDTLTLTSTDADANAGPNLRLYRNSSSPAPNDVIGVIESEGRNDNSEDIIYQQYQHLIADETDGTEDGYYEIYNMVAGTLRSKMKMIPTETVFNEDSVDIDFRIETNSHAYALFVDSGNEAVMFGGTGSGSSASDPRTVIFDYGQRNVFRNAASDVFADIFYNTNSGSAIGSIKMNGSATAFNTSSDYRLKENVDYTWDATTRLKQLKPARFNWIADDTNTLLDGFMAHEVSSIVPEAISGTKDQVATSDDVASHIAEAVGDPVYQGIDQSKLVPLMVKTIQELEARIKTLEDA